MDKKYCEYEECMMQNHLHYHESENTVTFRPLPTNLKEHYIPMNLLSISHNMLDNKTYLGLSVEEGIFSCHVFNQHHPFPMVEITDEELMRMRTFLNEIYNYRKQQNEHV